MQSRSKKLLNDVTMVDSTEKVSQVKTGAIKRGASAKGRPRLYRIQKTEAKKEGVLVHFLLLLQNT